MNIETLLNDKSLKPKVKTETLSKWLLDKTVSIAELLTFAQTAKDSPKATCIEALEYATKINPALANKECLEFVTETLTAKPPRVKWESAKVIGNIAHLFPGKLDAAINHLLANTEHEGTVVRWSAAYALGEIIMLNTMHNKELLPAIDAIINREEKNSIIKIYRNALKSVRGK